MNDRASGRVGALDYLRGVAVLGILLANLPGFGLPIAAAFSPAAWGGRTGADLWAWLLTFLVVEGRMRGLFSLLFGASMLLVIQRAEANGDDPGRTHFARMAWLYLFGIAHLYLLWWGDILAHYALVGCAAYAFRRLETRWLVAAGIALVAVQTLLALDAADAAFAAAPRGTPQQVAAWTALQAGFGVPPLAGLLDELAAMDGSWADGVAWRWATAPGPVTALPATATETLAYMLFGMAGLKSGLLTGGWSRARYRRWAVVGLAIGWPLYALLARAMLSHDLDARWVLLCSYALTVPIRPVMIAAYACALLLAMRPGGRLTRHLEAAGRVAFSNYLGTSLVMAWVFGGWGLGLFGDLGRAALYALAVPAFAAMLLWPGPWLGRYRYGPLEWVWRSLARLQWQPLRR